MVWTRVSRVFEFNDVSMISVRSSGMEEGSSPGA